MSESQAQLEESDKASRDEGAVGGDTIQSVPVNQLFQGHTPSQLNEQEFLNSFSNLNLENEDRISIASDSSAMLRKELTMRDSRIQRLIEENEKLKKAKEESDAMLLHNLEKPFFSDETMRMVGSANYGYQGSLNRFRMSDYNNIWNNFNGFNSGSFPRGQSYNVPFSSFGNGDFSHPNNNNFPRDNDGGRKDASRSDQEVTLPSGSSTFTTTGNVPPTPVSMPSKDNQSTAAGNNTHTVSTTRTQPTTSISTSMQYSSDGKIDNPQNVSKSTSTGTIPKVTKSSENLSSVNGGNHNKMENSPTPGTSRKSENPTYPEKGANFRHNEGAQYEAASRLRNFDTHSYENFFSTLQHRNPQPTQYFINNCNRTGKDYPKFDGDPLKWAVFIANYENQNRQFAIPDVVNLEKLEKALHGEAWKAVAGLFTLPSNLPLIIKRLQDRFGRPEFLIAKLLEKIDEIKSPKEGDYSALLEFSDFVTTLYSTLSYAGDESYLFDYSLKTKLIAKLPRSVKEEMAFKFQARRHSVKDIYEFLEARILIWNELNQIQPKSSKNNIESPTSTNRKSFKSGYRMNVHQEHTKEENKLDNQLNDPSKCFKCEGKHVLEKCKQFLDLNVPSRWQFVRDSRRICFICLLGRHKKDKCQASKCQIENCGKRHHKLLHEIKSPSTKQEEPIVHSSSYHSQEAELDVYFKIIPVRLYNGESAVETLAFLDGGSSVTLIDHDLSNKLKLEGPDSVLCLKWSDDRTCRTESNSKVVTFEISGVEENAAKFKITSARTTKELLSLPTQTINSYELKKDYKHLKGIPISCYTSQRPGIMIGIRHWKLGVGLNIREGPDTKEEPIAIKTRLGWVVCGPKKRVEGPKNVANFHYHLHTCECETFASDQDLHNLVKTFYTTEEFGVKVEAGIAESDEEIRAKNIMEKTIQRNGNQFEIGLLWKNDNVCLPNSLPMALKRWNCLERKLKADIALANAFTEKIEDYLAKGFCRVLSKEEAEKQTPRTWYLPIFPVWNPNKPGKMRLVFDSSAKVNGVSLNSVLLVGPDLLVPLVKVLFNWRIGKIAWSGDIREMFHMVRVIRTDCCALRFVAKRDLSSTEILVMEMCVEIFGAPCAPSESQFVKNYNALEFRDEFPEAYKAITDKHYVDDYCDSGDDEEKAIQLILDVVEVHKRGGFDIRNFISNSKIVMKAIQDLSNEESSVVKDMALDSSDSERVLGLIWNTDQDTLEFSLKFHKVSKDILEGIRVPTKREALQMVMSIFDPLGLIGPFIVEGKIILQETWSSGVGWDEAITGEIAKRWTRWTSHLKEIAKVKIPRCYSTLLSQANRLELHCFMDSSEEAFAAAAYLRVLMEDNIDTALICAKTRVAPRKSLSIPRLELQAAVLGSRLRKFVLQMLQLPVARVFMWSDSKTVLSWINSDTRRYKQFVANRVSEILENSNLEEWRWVPTALNVADDATKWKAAPDLRPSGRWFTGPEFLKTDESKWPEQITNQEIQEEIRPKFVGFHSTLPVYLTVCPNFANFRNYWKMVRTMATILRACQDWLLVLAKKPIVPIDTCALTPLELQLGEKLLIMKAQWDEYADEIIALQNSTPIDKGSKIRTLTPYLEDNVLKVEGRIQHAPGISEETKHPIILPRHSQFTEVLVYHYHRKFKHQGVDTVINEIRQKFWIPAIRQVVKKVIRACELCNYKNLQCERPQMAPLPAERLTSFVRAFTNTGVDAFGPYECSAGRGRSYLKRWGILFTCLDTRAIHIEVADSQSADDFILCLRNFIGRRGVPAKIFSDNGRNFVGAAGELKRAWSEKDEAAVINEVSSKGIEWVFIPPASPHVGGCWERLVRSVKTALKSVLNAQHPKEKVLRSLLIEVEAVINSRPLTYVSLESDAEPSITPNCFLLGTPGGTCTPGEFSDHDLCSRKQWRIVQQLTNHFWRRWIQEYLPILTKRSKWFEKQRNLEVGDVVVMFDSKAPRNTYKRGVIKRVYPGPDGQVRTVDVKTTNKKKVYRRTVRKLAWLGVKRLPWVSSDSDEDYSRTEDEE